jgi:integrase
MSFARIKALKKFIEEAFEKEDRNPNRPKKGDVIRVEPIRKKKHLEDIKELLKDDHRNLAMFAFGINTALRASDILRTKISDVEQLNPGETFILREKKTQKKRIVAINKATYEAIQGYLKVRPETSPDAPLFLSRTGHERAITVSALNALVKMWGRQVGVRENLGSHSLRKTFGYHQRIKGISIPTLLVIFNHSSQKQTLDYLGINEEEVLEAFQNVI